MNPDCFLLSPAKDGSSLSAMQSALDQKKDELRRALDMADSWRVQQQQSFQIAADLLRHIEQQKKISGSEREKGREGMGVEVANRAKEKPKGKPLKGSISTGN